MDVAMCEVSMGMLISAGMVGSVVMIGLFGW